MLISQSGVSTAMSAPVGKYDFDAVIDRKNTGSLKWDSLREHFGSDDLLPLWVADMDFRSPRPVIDALVERAKHGIYGYSSFEPAYYESVMNWYRRRYGWDIRREWMVYTPGVVPALNLIVQTFTEAGEGVIVQPPVYYPFFRVIESNGRHPVYNPLKLDGGRYGMDFKDLEKKAGDPQTKLMILCSPHNPVGRVWSREELERLGSICIENGVTVVADEIHSDLRYPGVGFTNFASISERFAKNSITCTSGTKTFNLAGLQISNIIIPDEKLRKAFAEAVFTAGTFMPNAFAATALQAAYDKCEDWLDELMAYIAGNLEFLKEFVRKRLHGVQVIEPEGTYLCWLDFSKLQPDPLKLEKMMRAVAKVALDEGYIFRAGGDGFERINLACPRSILSKALEQISQAVN